MAEKEKVVEEKIKYDGTLDFKEAYSFLYTLFSDWGYGLVEKEYVEKAKPDSKDLEVKWEGKKKVDDYFKYTVKIEWRILGLKNIEVMKDGKKEKAQSGSLEIKFVGILEKDYEDKWSGTPFLKFLRGVYDKFVIKQLKNQYEDTLRDEVKDALNQMKAFFSLEAKR